MKKFTALFCAGVMTLGLLSAGTVWAEDTGSTEGIQASPEFYAQADLSVLEGKKIGITIQSLENAYWAGVMTALQEQLDAAGANTTIVACDDSSATQIVKVMCWDDPMTNTDGNWILNNTDLGIAIGELTGEFINEHYSEDNKAEVTVIGYPQTTILKEREEGILQGMANVADGKYEIVANQAAIDANAAQTAMETILIAHPDCKVVTGIGAGAMIGADEALNIATGGNIPEDMAVITTDVTKQQLEQLASDAYPAKGIIGFEGSDEDTANACASMFALILSGSLETQNVFRGVAPITVDNVEAISAGMK